MQSAMIDAGTAGVWIAGWWAEASPLARAVAALLDPTWSATLLTNSPNPRTELDHVGAGFAPIEDTSLAAEVAHGAPARSLLFLEDDLARVADRPTPTSPAGIRQGSVGDRVVRWVEAEDPLAAVLLAIGSSGWPLLAWVCPGDDESLGLTPGTEIAGATIEAIAGSVIAIATVLHDDEDALIARIARSPSAQQGGHGERTT